MKRALLLLALAGCEGNFILPGGEGGGTGGNGAGGGGDIVPNTGDLSNLDVYTRLKPTCQGCHTMDQRPFFASLDAFENLVVYDPKYVLPGDPDHSLIIGLVTASVGRQMPPAPADAFITLEGKGQTHITVAELKDWILHLPSRGGPKVIDVPVVHRKTAEQMLRSLYTQLGLTETDFYSASWNPLAGDSYAVRSPDAVPYADATDQGGTLYIAMGGPHWLEGKWRNDTVTPGFVQSLTHISQAWCRTAVNKSGSVLLTRASLSDVSTTTAGAANIKANISELYLKMLGEEAPQAEVDDLFNNVFVRYESKGASTAWTAVCAALVRDPLWVLY
jgi:hypothetical protein